jgi:hypothetical protein
MKATEKAARYWGCFFCLNEAHHEYIDTACKALAGFYIDSNTVDYDAFDH